jgi:parvulin-like peptidyl-prolyl isomerase
MMKGIARKGVLAGMLFGLTFSSGCSWFRRGEEATKPVDDSDVYRSVRRADRDRVGDMRRVGVLESASGQPAALPAQTPRTNSSANGLSNGLSNGPSNASSNVSSNASANTPVGVMAAPTTRPVTAAPEYLVLGSIVANVNGAPIYAHDLLRITAPLLRAKAREMDEARFRSVALTELKKQRENLIRNELEYAAAQRNTTSEEAREAQARTFMYRERLISQAGGSLELARQLAREQGEDFDRLLAQEERRALVGIYYRKKVFPRVTMTVDEMRRYYEFNRDKQFTVPAQATFRVIRIDIQDVGSESAALDRANEAHRRAVAGEPFDALSDAYNKLPILVQNKGQVGPVSKGSYAIEAVEQAAWDTEPGKTAPVVRTPTALYVVQTVERKEGRVMAFDELEVQRAINASLRDTKMLDLQQRQRELLSKDAVIQADDAMLQPAIDMAMQMYTPWREGTAS